jgi:hypothetical protein
MGLNHHDGKHGEVIKDGQEERLEEEGRDEEGRKEEEVRGSLDLARPRGIGRQ